MSDVTPNPDEQKPDPQPSPSSAQPGATATSSGLEPNLAAGLAVLFGIIGGIVFYVIEKKNGFVRFYAMQSIFFGAAWIIAFIILQFILVIPIIHLIDLLLFPIVSIAGLIFWLITLVKAFGGKEEWEIPYLGQMARKQLARNDAGGDGGGTGA